MRMSFLSLVLGLVAPALVVAADLESIPADLARQLSTKLTEEAAKMTHPKVKIEGDAEKGSGFHVPKQLGALIVPQKGLKEGDELFAKFKTDTGASLAYLFVYHLVPVVEGKKVDASRLGSTNITDDQGTEHKVHILLLAAKLVGEDDYRLHVYGLDGKPLVDSKFAEGTGPGAEPVAVELKNPNKETREGTMVVTVFGKYQASFPAAFSE